MAAQMRRSMAAKGVAQEAGFAGFGGAGKPKLELNAKSAIVVAVNNGDLTSDEAEGAAELLFDVEALTDWLNFARQHGGVHLQEPAHRWRLRRCDVERASASPRGRDRTGFPSLLGRSWGP